MHLSINKPKRGGRLDVLGIQTFSAERQQQASDFLFNLCSNSIVFLTGQSS